MQINKALQGFKSAFFQNSIAMNLNLNSYKHLVAPLILLAAALLISFNFLAFAADEYTYMNTASAIARGNYADAPELSRFPLFPAILSVFFAIFGTSEIVAKLVNLLIALAGVVILYFVARKLFGEEVAGIAALILATNPLYIFFSSRVLTEPLYIIFLTLAVYFLYRVKDDLKNLIWFGAATAFAILTRYLALYLGIIAVTWLGVNGQLQNVIRSKWLYIGIIAFFVVLAPWLYLSYAATGNPFGFIIEFGLRQAQQQGVGFGLPDKIPSNLLAAPFVIGAPLVFASFLLRREIRDKFMKNDAIKFLLLASIVIALTLELAGFFRPSLLRYIAVIVPFLAMMAAFIYSSVRNERIKIAIFSINAKQILFAAIAVNLALSLGLIAFFGGYGYEKQVAYRQAGLYLKDNCNSTYGNIESVAQFYTGKQPAADATGAHCLAYSFYDGLNPSIPQGFAEVYRYGKVAVYKK